MGRFEGLLTSLFLACVYRIRACMHRADLFKIEEVGSREFSREGANDVWENRSDTQLCFGI